MDVVIVEGTLTATGIRGSYAWQVLFTISSVQRGVWLSGTLYVCVRELMLQFMCAIIYK